MAPAGCHPPVVEVVAKNVGVGRLDDSRYWIVPVTEELQLFAPNVGTVGLALGPHVTGEPEEPVSPNRHSSKPLASPDRLEGLSEARQVRRCRDDGPPGGIAAIPRPTVPKELHPHPRP